MVFPWAPFFCILFLLHFPHFAVGQSQQLSIRNSEVSSNWKNQQGHAEVSFEGAQYASEWNDNPRLKQSQLMETKAQGVLANSRWRHSADVYAGSFVNWGTSHFAIHELYSDVNWSMRQSTDPLKKASILELPTTNQKTQKGFSTTAGRKIENWNFLDDSWHLGLWQPQFSVDPLRVESEGLIGFFNRWAGDRHQLLIFATPIFLPTMNPEIREKNRGLVADSRWYRNPSTSLNIFGQEIRALYSLEDAEIEKIINNPGAAARWSYELQDQDSIWGMQLAVGYKPINSLSLRYKRDLITSLPNPDGVAVVAPVVSYHNVRSLDLNWRRKALAVGLGYIEDEPVRSLPQNSSSRIDWIQQQPQPLKVFGGHIGLSFEKTRIAFDRLKVSSQPTSDYDSQGQVRGSIFPHRTNFTDASRISWGQSWTSHLLSKLAWTRDEDQKGDLLQSEVNWAFLQQWVFGVGVDVLAVDDSDAKNIDDRFLNQFRSNDRIWSKVTYVF